MVVDEIDEIENLALEAESQDKQESGAGSEWQPGLEPEEPKVTGINTGEMLGGLLMVTFNQVLAPRRGEHWALQAEEGLALGEAYGEVVDKYFPDFSGGCELTAIAVTLAVVGPRLMQDKAISPSETETETVEGDGKEPE